MASSSLISGMINLKLTCSAAERKCSVLSKLSDDSMIIKMILGR